MDEEKEFHDSVEKYYKESKVHSFLENIPTIPTPEFKSNLAELFGVLFEPEQEIIEQKLPIKTIYQTLLEYCQKINEDVMVLMNVWADRKDSLHEFQNNIWMKNQLELLTNLSWDLKSLAIRNKNNINIPLEK
jgi:hypothetical protein